MHIMDAFPNITEDKEVFKIKETTRPHRPTKETTRPHRPYERNHAPIQAIRNKPRAYTGHTKETTRLYRPYERNHVPTQAIRKKPRAYTELQLVIPVTSTHVRTSGRHLPKHNRDLGGRSCPPHQRPTRTATQHRPRWKKLPATPTSYENHNT